MSRNIIRVQKETPLTNVVTLDTIKNLIKVLEDAGAYLGDNIGLELDVIPAKTYILYQKIFNGKQLVDI